MKQRAFELKLPVYQPTSLKTDEAREIFGALAPELVVVVAYGKILPSWLLNLPRYGCINLHGSLLPKYRGAAPVHWAIANGETQTGVCSMLLDVGLDTGPTYLCQDTVIGPDESVAQLYDRLAILGAPLMLATIEGIVNGTLQPRPQDHARASMAPILKKEDGFLDWAMTAVSIHNRVRAFNPWPGTVATFRGTICKILRTKLSPPSPSGKGQGAEQTDALGVREGTILPSKNSLQVLCGGATFLEILTIQPQNRKPVSGADFANGARIQPGEKFEPLVDN